MFWSDISARVLSVVTSEMAKSKRTQWADCLLMWPAVSTEVQHHTSPSNIRWPRRCRVNGAWKIFELFTVTLSRCNDCKLVSVDVYSFINWNVFFSRHCNAFYQRWTWFAFSVASCVTSQTVYSQTEVTAVCSVDHMFPKIKYAQK